MSTWREDREALAPWERFVARRLVDLWVACLVVAGLALILGGLPGSPMWGAL